MSPATHATVMTLRRDLSKRAEQEQVFQNMIEQGIGVIPGCVAGLWTFDADASEVVIVHSFDAAGAAGAFAQFAIDNAERQTSLGFDLVSLRVTEVLGTA